MVVLLAHLLNLSVCIKLPVFAFDTVGVKICKFLVGVKKSEEFDTLFCHLVGGVSGDAVAGTECGVGVCPSFGKRVDNYFLAVSVVGFCIVGSIGPPRNAPKIGLSGGIGNNLGVFIFVNVTLFSPVSDDVCVFLVLGSIKSEYNAVACAVNCYKVTFGLACEEIELVDVKSLEKSCLLKKHGILKTCILALLE